MNMRLRAEKSACRDWISKEIALGRDSMQLQLKRVERRLSLISYRVRCSEKFSLYLKDSVLQGYFYCEMVLRGILLLTPSFDG